MARDISPEAEATVKVLLGVLVLLTFIALSIATHGLVFLIVFIAVAAGLILFLVVAGVAGVWREVRDSAVCRKMRAFTEEACDDRR